MTSNEVVNLIERFDLRLVKSISCPTNSVAFENAIQIYINKPQVVNKWLAGSVTTKNCDTTHVDSRFSSLLDNHLFKTDYREFIPKNSKIFSSLTYLIVANEANTKHVLFSPLVASSCFEHKYASISLCHLFELTEDGINLYIDETNLNRVTDLVHKKKIEFQINWLADTLLPKLVNWCLSIKVDDQMSSSKLTTLTLYENMINDYICLYQELKEVYWRLFAPDWFELTNTDPEKFIHEDVAIATYFILVWRNFDLKIKQFVDIGCGNGLLVYILNDQGYMGYGVDMRRRRVWDKFGIKLLEKTIDPQCDTFEDCDWLIGNHSDELSPWLPIIASKSSRISKSHCNFLLIPCCLFDLHSKFEVKKNNESRYETYLNYLEKLSNLCGFKVYRDKLRIPSTRNVCFISLMSASGEVEVKQSDVELKEKLDRLVNNTAEALIEFKPRNLEEEKSKSSRNCTRNIDQDLKTTIVKRVLENLLDVPEPDRVYLRKHDDSKWHVGKSVNLSEIAMLFEKDVLQKLKQECGGIKTLLKNYHQLFAVFDKDKVKLKVWNSNKPACESPPAKIQKPNEIERFSRKPSNNKISKTSNSVTHLKTKQCLFDLWHPDGCILKEDECDFIHTHDLENIK